MQKIKFFRVASDHASAALSVLLTRNFHKNVLCASQALEFSHGQDPKRTSATNLSGLFSSPVPTIGLLPYKGKPVNPGEIARNLAVRYQVEGSVRQTGDRVRVNAQLVDTTGQVLWSASFDEALADLFALQDKITVQIAGALAIRVSQAEQRRVFAKPTKSLEAYDYVLRARPALLRPARANTVEARVLLRRAIEIDPNYAAAYAALAETYFAAVSMGWAESPTVFMSRAEEMANKALSLDDSDVRAHIMLGRIHIFYHRYEQAKAEIDHAIAINPNDANGIAGNGNILMWTGQTDAAIEALELAQRISTQITGKLASAKALNSHCDNGPASNPIRLKW
jgi:adenylate cyclase